jgi:DNA helicase HerA-like ATPase
MVDEIAESEKMIQDAGSADREIWKDNPEEGGSVNNFRNALRQDIYRFIKEEDDRLLKIYNPSRLFASKQVNEPRSWRDDTGNWNRGASLYNITPVEVTQIISESVLDILSEEMTDHAKVCLVYEEAHALIPEWNSTVVEGDKSATSGTARAILQGRKYGLGCILITQRTANVTKTILNQCNSIFAMRTFDHTGIEYLSNYIGDDYSSILTTLPERHAVFFGKASSCENPVLLELNNRDDFRRAFREIHPIIKLVKKEIEEGDFVDDLPS